MEALVTDSDRDQNFYRSNAVSEVAMLFSVVKMLKRLPRIRRWSRIAIFSKTSGWRRLGLSMGDYPKGFSFKPAIFEIRRDGDIQN